MLAKSGLCGKTHQRPGGCRNMRDQGLVEALAAQWASEKAREKLIEELKKT